MMLHEVEKRAISSTQRLLQPGLARAKTIPHACRSMSKGHFQFRWLRPIQRSTGLGKHAGRLDVAKLMQRDAPASSNTPMMYPVLAPRWRSHAEQNDFVQFSNAGLP